MYLGQTNAITPGVDAPPPTMPKKKELGPWLLAGWAITIGGGALAAYYLSKEQTGKGLLFGGAAVLSWYLRETGKMFAV